MPLEKAGRLKYGQNSDYSERNRAIVGFGIGDKLFNGRIPSPDTPFVECGDEEITTLEQAREAAEFFADYVS